MADDSKVTVPNTSRRRWLKLIGATGAVGLAGCSSSTGNNGGGDGNGNGNSDTSGGGGSGTSSNTQSGGKPISNTFRVPTSPVSAYIDTVGFNPYNSKTKATTATYFSAEKYTSFNPKTNEFRPMLLKGWDIGDDGTITVTVDNSYKWQNGDPITAKDIALGFKLSIASGYALKNLVENPKVKSDTEFTLDLIPDSINPVIFGLQVMNGGTARTPHKFFAKYGDRLDKASSDKETEKVISDLQSATMSLDQYLASGPFKIDKMTEQGIYLSKNKHSPLADSFNFDHVQLVAVKSKEVIQSLLASDRVDAAYGRFSESFLKSLSSHHKAWYQQFYGGNGLFYNLTDDIIGKREVRQALQYVFNQDQIVNAIDYKSIPVKYITGMPDNTAETYLGKDFIQNKLTDYSGSQTKKAAKLLQSAGFSKKGGKWHTPSGDVWNFTIRCPAGDDDRINEATVGKQQLNDFGIKAQVNTIESASFWSRFHKRDYTVCMGFYASRGAPHPYFDYQNLYFGETYNLDLGLGKNWTGIKKVVQMPKEIGNPNSEMTDYPLHDKIDQLQKTTDEKKTDQIVKELAWCYNQNCFGMPIDVGVRPTVMTTDDWVLPNAKEFMATHSGIPYPPLFQEGKIKAKTK